MLGMSQAFSPVMMKGIKVHPDNGLLFDFILDSGKTGLRVDSPEFKAESQKLIKYFLASLTIPEKDLWVNLSPYEKDRMLTEELGQTVLGEDMLAQDYILKQLTASLLYPEKDLGKAFWSKVYSQAQEKFGTSDIPVDTFNKVWITADKAKVLERNGAAYVVGAHLKVMIESDYLAQSNATSHQLPATSSNSKNIAKDVLREVVIPEIEKEVNTGANFAPLRQMFYAMILSTWYKRALKSALLNEVYSDKAKTSGVLADDPAAKEQIYAQYLEAYRKGVFNYIKETPAGNDGERVPRKYFSGGVALGVDQAMTIAPVLALGDNAQAEGTVAVATVSVMRSDAAMAGKVRKSAGTGYERTREHNGKDRLREALDELIVQAGLVDDKELAETQIAALGNFNMPSFKEGRIFEALKVWQEHVVAAILRGLASDKEGVVEAARTAAERNKWVATQKPLHPGSQALAQAMGWTLDAAQVSPRFSELQALMTAFQEVKDWARRSAAVAAADQRRIYEGQLFDVVTGLLPFRSTKEGGKLYDAVVALNIDTIGRAPNALGLFRPLIQELTQAEGRPAAADEAMTAPHSGIMFKAGFTEGQARNVSQGYTYTELNGVDGPGQRYFSTFFPEGLPEGGKYFLLRQSASHGPVAFGYVQGTGRNRKAFVVKLNSVKEHPNYIPILKEIVAGKINIVVSRHELKAHAYLGPRKEERTFVLVEHIKPSAIAIFDAKDLLDMSGRNVPSVLLALRERVLKRSQVQELARAVREYIFDHITYDPRERRFLLRGNEDTRDQVWDYVDKLFTAAMELHGELQGQGGNLALPGVMDFIQSLSRAIVKVDAKARPVLVDIDIPGRSGQTSRFRNMPFEAVKGYVIQRAIEQIIDDVLALPSADRAQAVAFAAKSTAELQDFLRQRFDSQGKIKILFVEDSPLPNMVVKDIFLGYEGIEVLYAENTADALRIMEANPDIALAILDNDFPPQPFGIAQAGEGLRLARTFSERSPDAEVVMHSARAIDGYAGTWWDKGEVGIEIKALLAPWNKFSTDNTMATLEPMSIGNLQAFLEFHFQRHQTVKILVVSQRRNIAKWLSGLQKRYRNVEFQVTGDRKEAGRLKKFDRNIALTIVDDQLTPESEVPGPGSSSVRPGEGREVIKELSDGRPEQQIILLSPVPVEGYQGTFWREAQTGSNLRRLLAPWRKSAGILGNFFSVARLQPRDYSVKDGKDALVVWRGPRRHGLAELFVNGLSVTDGLGLKDSVVLHKGLVAVVRQDDPKRMVSIYRRTWKGYEPVGLEVLTAFLEGEWQQGSRVELVEFEVTTGIVSISLGVSGLSGAAQTVRLKLGELAESRIDPAMADSVGGIDLDARNMDLEVAGEGAGLDMKVDPALVAEFQQGDFSGVEGVILRIVPVSGATLIL
jgi:CheY-like chemotaxis protein